MGGGRAAAATLVQMCINAIVNNISYWSDQITSEHLEKCRILLTPFDEEALPDHLALQIVNGLSSRNRLSVSALALFLNSSLAHLDLRPCAAHVTDLHAKQIAFKATHLRHLYLARCFKLSNSSVLSLIRSERFLESLDLSGCSKLMDNVINELANNCNHLKCLRLAGLNKLTDKSLAKAFHNMTKLQELDLSGCSKVTDATVSVLLARCPELKILGLEG